MITYVLFGILIIFAFVVGKVIGRLQSEKTFKQRLLDARKDSNNRSRSIIKGQVAETFAPLMPNFPIPSNQCQFLGKPVDFIGFKEDDKGNISEVLFIEVKSGSSKLSKREKSLQSTIDAGNVSYVIYNAEK